VRGLSDHGALYARIVKKVSFSSGRIAKRVINSYPRRMAHNRLPPLNPYPEPISICALHLDPLSKNILAKLECYCNAELDANEQERPRLTRPHDFHCILSSECYLAYIHSW